MLQMQPLKGDNFPQALPAVCDLLRPDQSGESLLITLVYLQILLNKQVRLRATLVVELSNVTSQLIFCT